MDHGVMQGMMWAGVLLSAIPVLVSAGVAIYVLQRYRLDGTPRLDRMPRGERAS